ncbi:Urease accessory protein UreE (plasmid) [Thermus thermophilus]|uniref:Urease accessory protein UreE n=1 Tax=Thermus thermophilus TaxID=274 RepID=A0A3P4AW10_THETH|nr:Urease accessory protein UreE [Thermus thermophilus]
MEPILITRLPDAGNREEGLETVPIPLTVADRRRVRRLLTAPDGQAFYLALPTGTVLRPGTVLWAGGGRAYMVTAAEEDLLRSGREPLGRPPR